MKSVPNPTLLILAAGMGSRYGGLKQIDPVGSHGETIIDYSVYDAIRAGFGKLVCVIRRDIETHFRQIVGAKFERHIPVEYVFQELERLPSGYSVPAGRTKPWGTTHAILAAADVIREPFAVINADDFYGFEGYRALVGHLRSDTSDYAMVGFILRNTLSDFGTVSRGVCRLNGNGLLHGVTELTKIERNGNGALDTDPDGRVTPLTGGEIASMNMWGFTPAVFDQLEEYFQQFLKREGANIKSECYIPSAVNSLIDSGRAKVKVLQTNDSWFGVTYREDRAHVVEGIRQCVRDGRYPEQLW